MGVQTLDEVAEMLEGDVELAAACACGGGGDDGSISASQHAGHLFAFAPLVVPGCLSEGRAHGAAVRCPVRRLPDMHTRLFLLEEKKGHTLERTKGL
jgi:hypothetical protein